jgi:hypothetical protein
VSTRTHIGVRQSLCNGSTNVTTDFAKVDCKVCLGLPWAKWPIKDIVVRPAKELKLIAGFIQYCLDLFAWDSALTEQMGEFLQSKDIKGGDHWLCEVSEGIHAWPISGGFTLCCERGPLRGSRTQQRFSRDDAERFDECLAAFLERVTARPVVARIS